MTEKELYGNTVVSIVDIRGKVPDLILTCNNIIPLSVMLNNTNKLSDSDKIEMIVSISKGKLDYVLDNENLKFNLAYNEKIFINNKQLTIRTIPNTGEGIIEDIVLCFPNDMLFSEVASKCNPKLTIVQKDSAIVNYAELENFIKLYKENKFRESFK